MAVPISTRDATIPTGLVGSWYRNTFGAGPASGNAPALKRISVPSDTRANVSYGAAIAVMVRRGVSPVDDALACLW